MAYGDSYSAVQNAALQEAALRHSALESAINRGVSSIQSLRQQQNQNREFAMQKVQYADLLKQRELENNFRQEQADLGNRKLDVQNSISQGYLDLGRQQLDLQKGGGTPAQIRDKEFMINRAATDADRGIFDSPDHVTQLYPSVTPEIAQGLFAHSKLARGQMEDNYNFASNAAQALNQQALLEGKIKQAKNNFGMFTDNRQDRSNIDQWQTQLNNLQKFTSRLTSDKRFHDLLTIDPNSGVYTSTVSAPPWMKTGKPDPTTDENGNGAAPTAQPDGGNFEVRPFNQSIFGSGAPAVPDAGMGDRSINLGDAGASAAGTPRNPQTGNYSGAFYDRVNVLVGQGMDPRLATKQALSESAAMMPGPAGL